MKTKLALALAAVGFLIGIPLHTFAAETPEIPPLPGNVEFRHWHQGEPPLRLIRKEEGFCALTGVGGGFQGGGEEIHVYVGDDGYWYLGGKSKQHGVDAECVVVRYPAVLPTPLSAKHVDVLAASYSFGSEYADVTARVKKLLHDGKTFQANPESLLVDPHPGWNKALVVFCKVGGKRAIFSVGEGEAVSHDLLAEKARVVVAKTPKHAGTHRAKALLSGSENSEAADDAQTF